MSALAAGERKRKDCGHDLNPNPPKRQVVPENGVFMTRAIVHPANVKSKTILQRIDAIKVRSISAQELQEVQEIDQYLLSGSVPPFLAVIECKKINSLGLYAIDPLPPGKIVGVYAGLITTRYSIGNPYIYDLDGYLRVDGRNLGNYTKRINGVADPKQANVESFLVKIDGIVQILIRTKNQVLPSSQLLLDYGKESYWDPLGVEPTPLKPSDQ